MSKKTKGHCPTCGPDKNAEIVAEYAQHSDDDGHVSTRTNHRILKCGGCDSVYHGQARSFSEDVYTDENGETQVDEKFTYWPAATRRRRPEWLWNLRDPTLSELLEELYTCLDHDDLHVSAALIMRTALDRAALLLGVDPAMSFGEKLDDLFNRGEIGTSDREHLRALIDVGNAAAHQAWSPSVQELGVMTDVLEGFIKHRIILSSAVAEMRSRIPQRQKRQKPRHPTNPI
jgi:hypothetical protein